jgi:hypothetical protein
MNKIRKFGINENYVDEIVLRYWAFDWDDNILDMPTKILMDQKVGSDWKPVEVSTADFAQVRNDVENYRIRNGSPEEAFSEFRDTGSRGSEAFIEDVEHCISDSHFGPAFENFLECLSEGGIFSIITARGHEPESIRRGVEYIIDNILTQKPGSISGMTMADEMLQNVKKFKYWFEGEGGTEYKISGSPSSNPLIQEYLSHCDYFGVSSESFANKFSGGTAQAPEESKKQALMYSINRCFTYAKQLEDIMNRPVRVTYGMSDDDPKTSKAIIKLFEDITNEDEELSKYITLYYFQTTGGKVDKTIFTPKEQSTLDAQKMIESSHQATGLESSVMPFTKWNNMTQRLHPSSKDAPTDAYHNQMKNQVGYTSDLGKDVFKQFRYKRKNKRSK